MKPKKNLKVNLEKRRGLHIQLGLTLALSLILISLEWTTPQLEQKDLSMMGFITPEPEIIKLIPREKKPKEKKIQPTVLIPVPPEEINPDDLDKFKLDVEFFEGKEVDLSPPDLPEEEIVEPVFSGFVQVPAEFPGGEKAMMKWIYSRIEYPKLCSENGVEGRVTAMFTISKLGVVSDIKIIGSAHPDLDAEVLRVLKLMPKFRPAMQNGQLVPVYMTWPVHFRLD